MEFKPTRYEPAQAAAGNGPHGNSSEPNCLTTRMGNVAVTASATGKVPATGSALSELCLAVGAAAHQRARLPACVGQRRIGAAMCRTGGRLPAQPAMNVPVLLYQVSVAGNQTWKLHGNNPRAQCACCWNRGRNAVRHQQGDLVVCCRPARRPRTGIAHPTCSSAEGSTRWSVPLVELPGNLPSRRTTEAAPRRVCPHAGTQAGRACVHTAAKNAST